MSTVSIIRCDTYENERIEKAVRNALSLIGDLKEKIKPGMKVLLKPNLLLAGKPDSAITTHPSVLRAVTRIVKECGARPFIGDNCGNAYANVSKALEVAGFRNVALEEGAELLSLAKPVKHGDFYVADTIFGMDAIIDLPKLKTHNLTLFTGCIKNMFGILPGFYKGEIHCKNPHPEDFAERMVEIFSIKKPVLGVMDAVYGMEGHGPSGGKPKKIGLIMASYDCVSLDAVSSEIIGYNPLDIDTTRIAHQKGIGEGRLEKIEIKGENLRDCKVPDFERVDNANKILKRVPRFVYPFFQFLTTKLLWVHPAVIREKCTGCKVCFLNCPVKAITMVEGKASINYKKCISCYCCHELCPEKAYRIDRSWLARQWVIGVQD
ncbi:hypothetical protein COY52_02960 [Candidatus Desantisbacteria bacterium CG_4_10_14_0_8_um_filter_48_22]|uniref:4Fe-4S ferredoxin-type domain-containing protein n=1 Tax=Candidatus Desantisbacteria bacterium CG_4_10_14_0_8_um_filter_48_22 TaxID=1974543 RepID=A0A2M7SE76_9BACT|nr:MAG: hypothetical protein AUJ67_02415 [Candidatus Desantisbacteria bacterium CG1_02_49_89]PIV57437.1 MAG: hypothetical protein COS16_00115 [Candidatus Desantisbacteria bacterium CG02_land_8_20_14_3_00_49_13]PIZ17781.1 MAG: hypothetical protein COY52_02960 [Candidatus Desantisbacteria bacterium CG_4_10_14_0_8_um_filter_48_22]